MSNKEINSKYFKDKIWYSETISNIYRSIQERTQRKQRFHNYSIIDHRQNKSLDISGTDLLRQSVLSKYVPDINHQNRR